MAGYDSIFSSHLSPQNDETNTTSDDETSSKRSVRFNEETGDETTEGSALDEDGKSKTENQLTDYVTHMSLKRHSSLFNNALRRKIFFFQVDFL